MDNQIKEMLYEGKAKRVYKTDEADVFAIEYKDDATAFNGEKKGQIKGKGAINNEMTALIFQKLEKEGIPTHFIKQVDERFQLARRVEIVPLEVIVRNLIAGSMAKRLGREEGEEPKCTILEFSYKDDALGDPLINRYHAIAIGAATEEEVDRISDLTFRINDILKAIFDEAGLILVDFKLEFGRTPDGEIILADEISPDTCRLWDKKTREKLDKDRFRRDLGGVEEAYVEVLKRLRASLH